MEKFDYITCKIVAIQPSYPYRARIQLEDAKLVDSIQSVGLLIPVVVEKVKPNTWALLDGHRRLEGLKKLFPDEENIPAIEVKLESWGKRLRLIKGLRSEMWKPCDELFFLMNLLQQNLNEEEIKELLNSFHLIPKAKNVKRLANLVKDFQQKDWEVVGKLNLSIHQMLKWEELPEKDRKFLFQSIFPNHSFTKNQIDHLLEWFAEIYSRDQKSLESVLKPLIQELKAGKMDIVAQSKKIYEKVFQIRFPQRSLKMKDIEQVQSAMKKKASQLTIVPSESLEDAGYVLSTHIKKAADIQKFREQFLQHEDELKKLLNLMI